jgi:hypothetical protein
LTNPLVEVEFVPGVKFKVIVFPLTLELVTDGAPILTPYAVFEAPDAKEVPLAFVAVTLNVYAVLWVKPITLIDPLDVVPVTDPGVDVAVYVLIADPPVAPEVYVTLTNPLNVVAVPIVGARGTVVPVIAVEVATAVVPCPVAFTEKILKFVANPLSNPVRIKGLPEDGVVDMSTVFEL